MARLTHGVRVSLLGIAVLLASTVACRIRDQRPPEQRTPERDRAAVARLEHQWLTAADSPTLSRILAADFRHPVSSGDVLTKPQQIAWVVSHPVAPSVHRRFATLTIRVIGDAAIVDGMVVRTDDAGCELGRNLFTDVFANRNDTWQAVSAEETPVAAQRSAGRAVTTCTPPAPTTRHIAMASRLGRP